MFFQGLANELTARTGAVYVAESVIGLFLALIFLYFSKEYSRNYLRTWALSWFAFSLSAFCLGFATLYGLSRNDEIRILTAYLSQVGTYLHVLFLLAGTYELVKVKNIKLRVLLLYTGAIVVFSLIVVMLYNSDTGPEASQYRYFLRLVLRHSIVAACFFAAGIIVLMNPVFIRSFGKRLMMISFFSYGMAYLYYSILGVLLLAGVTVSFPFFFGTLELLLICIIGLSMVIWLLEDERHRISKINKELDSFLYSTSHDLRAPIASILGLTNLARLEIQDPVATQFMVMIDDRVKKLDTVIADILTLSRSQKVEIKMESIDFNELFKETINELKFNEGASQIKLNYDRNPLNIFWSDKAQMKIVLSNLIGNAVKYHNPHQPNQFINVGFKRINRLVEITVEDNGRGIASESLPKIFDMFYRATSAVDGTGLGLYIVKESLSKINGTIRVTSEESIGTTFTIVLANA
jgi:signal transduction histidine kinase